MVRPARSPRGACQVDTDEAEDDHRREQRRGPEGESSATAVSPPQVGRPEQQHRGQHPVALHLSVHDGGRTEGGDERERQDYGGIGAAPSDLERAPAGEHGQDRPGEDQSADHEQAQPGERPGVGGGASEAEDSSQQIGVECEQGRHASATTTAIARPRTGRADLHSHQTPTTVTSTPLVFAHGARPARTTRPTPRVPRARRARSP